jgi:UDP-N-acetylmuramate dehydrogenase
MKIPETALPETPLHQTLLPRPHSLSAANTLGLASWADAYVEISDLAQLPGLTALAARHARTLVLGGGSNLVLPQRVEGLVVKTAMRGMRCLLQDSQRTLVEAAAGEPWPEFVAACVARGWDGLENLAMIPGSVGAAPVQNIGAYGVELSDRFDGLSAWDIRQGKPVAFSAEDCRLAYRDSRFKHDAPGRWLITAVRFSLPRPWAAQLNYPELRRHESLAETTRPTARDIFEAVCQIRRDKLPDPLVLGNAGSFFKNPIIPAARYEALQARFPGIVAYPQADGAVKLAAGWLIDQCGWKGRAMGRAAVHDRQALVLVNRGGATAQDILALANAIAADVSLRFGVQLHPEPVIVTQEAASPG